MSDNYRVSYSFRNTLESKYLLIFKHLKPKQHILYVYFLNSPHFFFFLLTGMSLEQNSTKHKWISINMNVTLLLRKREVNLFAFLLCKKF